ncbi:THAP-type domain-containing protein [Aphis craccivora]|uniref:THAP-type domain-containing protein n=1 Tax=Aphis craccivora TaxID=307492 RepID=A0A6G0Y743_APHCR|nr:THAP-type domain-containing protein [Aphis craccivora]
MFFFVIFSPAKDYSVFPINWLIETETKQLSASTIQYCYWPSTRVTSTDLIDAIDPDQSWLQYKVRVVGGNKTYIESTDNENILNHPFKRNKKSITVETSDSSENEDSSYTIVPPRNQNELLFNTTKTQQNSTQVLISNQETFYTNLKPSTSTSTHGNIPAFADNQEKSYTNLNVQSVTTPNSIKMQYSSMMQPLAYYESSYTESQVNHFDIQNQSSSSSQDSPKEGTPNILQAIHEELVANRSMNQRLWNMTNSLKDNLTLRHQWRGGGRCNGGANHGWVASGSTGGGTFGEWRVEVRVAVAVVAPQGPSYYLIF